MKSGKLVSRPRKKMLRGSSLKDKRKPNSPAVIMPARKAGNSISQNRRHGVAPSTAAASVRRTSKRTETTNIASSEKGSAQVKCPTKRDHSPSLKPRKERKYRNNAVPMTTPGTKRGRSAAINSPPRQRTRNKARPTKVAMTAQAIPTAAASPILNCNGPDQRRSPNRRKYQSVVKGPGWPVNGSVLTDITASHRIGTYTSAITR